MYPLAPSLDHVGLFAATSSDAVLGYQAISDMPVSLQSGSFSVGWIPPGLIAVIDPRVEELTWKVVTNAGFDLEVRAALLSLTSPWI